MSYEISTEVEQGHIKLVVSGEQTLENNKKLVFQILEACAENNVSKALIDIRGIWGQPGVLADYDLANLAAKEALGAIKRAALLYRQESQTHTSFFETVIRNRGIDLLAFLDENEAVEWLLGRPV